MITIYASTNWTLLESFACKMFNVNPLDLLGPSREVELVSARFIVWKALSATRNMSPSEISRKYSRDHSSIIYGIKAAGKGELKEKYVHFIKHFYLEYPKLKIVDKPVDKYVEKPVNTEGTKRG